MGSRKIVLTTLLALLVLACPIYGSLQRRRHKLHKLRHAVRASDRDWQLCFAENWQTAWPRCPDAAVTSSNFEKCMALIATNCVHLVDVPEDEEAPQLSDITAELLSETIYLSGDAYPINDALAKKQAQQSEEEEEPDEGEMKYYSTEDEFCDNNEEVNSEAQGCKAFFEVKERLEKFEKDLQSMYNARPSFQLKDENGKSWPCMDLVPVWVKLAYMEFLLDGVNNGEDEQTLKKWITVETARHILAGEYWTSDRWRGVVGGAHSNYGIQQVIKYRSFSGAWGFQVNSATIAAEPINMAGVRRLEFSRLDANKALDLTQAPFIKSIFPSDVKWVDILRKAYEFGSTNPLQAQSNDFPYKTGTFRVFVVRKGPIADYGSYVKTMYPQWGATVENDLFPGATAADFIKKYK